MKRFALILAIMLVLLSVLAVLHAQETGKTCANTPNDGSGLPQCETPADNECYSGGTMGGKCENEWAWVCGWYMARFNRGVISASQVAGTCASLLPAPPDGPAGTTEGSVPASCTVTFDTLTATYTATVHWPVQPAQVELQIQFLESAGGATYAYHDIGPTDTSAAFDGEHYDSNPKLGANAIIMLVTERPALTIPCLYIETP